MMKISYLIAFLFFMLPPVAATAAEKAGDVVYVKGSAMVERQAKTVKAILKAPLQETDNVFTRDRTRIKMLFRDDSILTLGANSKLFIRQYLSSPDAKRTESIYELADGKLKAVVGGPGFKVMTPTAFAAARGTVLTIWYDSDTKTTGLAVTEGKVEVRNLNPDIGGTLVLGPGQTTNIPGNGPPGPPRAFTPGGPGPSGGVGAVYSELNENTLPEPEGPTVSPISQVLDLQRQAAQTPAAPPIDQIPANLTSVILNLVFP